MAEKLEDLKLPHATVQKIIRESLPDSVKATKDVTSALSTAASVFVLYVTSQATKEASKTHRKTILGQDIVAALEELEFDDFIGPLQQSLKDSKKPRQKKGGKGKKGAEEEIEEIDDEEDGK